MKKEEIVNEIFSALEKKNWDKVEQKLTEDFTFSGAVPKPINKKDWVGVHRAIQTGMPDLKFNLTKLSTQGDKVIAKVKLEGTHSIELPPITTAGTRAIPPTGKKVKLPEEEIELTFAGDKISNFNVKPVPHGGVQGILEQIGMPVKR